jgi:hypothetical protein
MSEWRTDAPDYWTWIQFADNPCDLYQVVDDEYSPADLQVQPRTACEYRHPWRYVAAMDDAACFGVRVAWLIAFVQHVVPLGLDAWSAGVPDIGRWCVTRSGFSTLIGDADAAWAWHEDAHNMPETDAWRYLEPHEVPE